VLLLAWGFWHRFRTVRRHYAPKHRAN
jgi:hypothetical protein